MVRKQHYPVHLSAEERRALAQIVRTGVRRDADRAQMLLWSADGMSDLAIAARLAVTPLTVAQARRRWAETRQVADRPRPGVAKKLSREQEIALLELEAGEPPDGRKHWSAQRLADRLLETGVIDAPISDETVRRVLKKRR